MNSRQYNALALRGTDVEGTIKRFGGNEIAYTYCLWEFLSDPTMDSLCKSIKGKLWDDAFTAAHALKGLAGNMGFVPLMHSVAQMIVLIRGGRLSDIDESLTAVNSSYRDIIDAIHQFFDLANENA